MNSIVSKFKNIKSGLNSRYDNYTSKYNHQYADNIKYSVNVILTFIIGISSVFCISTGIINIMNYSILTNNIAFIIIGLTGILYINININNLFKS